MLINDNKYYNKTMVKRDRWTILDVDENSIKLLKKYAKINGYTTGKAISEVILNSVIKTESISPKQLKLPFKRDVK